MRNSEITGFAVPITMKPSILILLTLLAGLVSVLIDVGQTERVLLAHWLSLGLLTTALMLLSGWLSLRRVCLEPEPVKTELWGELIGDPTFDPERGIIGSFLHGDKTIKVVIQPKWWPYFSSDLLRNEKEASCAGSPVSKVDPGKEPKFVVVIQDEHGNTKGIGSRALVGNSDILLTSYHVIDSAPRLFLAKYSNNEKTGKRVEIDFQKWDVDFGSNRDELDIIGIKVPTKVWSSLGVGSVRAKAPTASRAPVQLFGADSSSSWKSSSGLGAFVSKFTGTHSATTTNGWSGSPVISGGCLIGVHRGVDQDKINSNKFTVMHPVFYPRGLETMWDHGYIHELDDEQFETRGSEFEHAIIGGRGKVFYSDSEFFLDDVKKPRFTPKKGDTDWRDANIEEEDIDDLYADPEFNADIQERKKMWGLDRESGLPLNYQGAEGVQSSPPLSTSDDTPTMKGDQSEPAGCPSLSLDNRVSNLEKLLEPLLVSVQLMQEIVSQNSKILTGLNAEVLRNSIPSCSKQPASSPPKSPTTSGKQSSNLSKNTPEQGKEIALKPTGTKQPSEPKSKRSRRRKSKGTPPQESPLPV